VDERGNYRLAVHRRTMELDGRRYTVLSPRPSVACRFATNRYHETWHVLTDADGAALLGQLFWAMSYQRRERTIIVIDTPLLVPNPFDADPSSPIVIVNNDLGALPRAAVADLRPRLPFRTPSEGTVVLQTRGLDVALSDEAEFRRREEQAGWQWKAHQQRRWVDRVNGTLVIAAPPPVLRAWGVRMSLPERWTYPDAEYLDWPDVTGEVQILDDLEGRVSRATAARELLFPGRGHQELGEEERRQVWAAGAGEPSAGSK
jgi:hypothetical protein